MAETALATAYVKILPSFAGFKTELEKNLPDYGPTGTKSGQKFAKGFGGGLGTGLKGAFATVLAGGAVASFTKDLISAGEAEIASNKKLENIAKSMGIFGDQAGVVSKRLEDLSGQQQLALGIDDDTIKSTQMKLLTFKNLALTAGQAGGMFDRATLAAQDLAAAGFGTAETNAVQLGKALQDPIKGITSLARSGVTFTEQEKKKIETLVKSGKILDAQNMVMKAIETQVGGTAAAGVTSSMKMEQAFNQFKESLGLALMPMFNKLADFFTKTLIPKLQDFFDRFKKGQTFLNPVINGIKGFIDFVVTNKDFLLPIVAGIGAIVAALKVWNIITGIATTIQWLFNVALDANPIGAVVLAIMGIVTALTIFFTKTETGRKVFKALKDGFVTAFNFIKTIAIDFANFWITIIDGIISAVNVLLTGLKYVTFGAINIQIPKIPKITQSTDTTALKPMTATPAATTKAVTPTPGMAAVTGTTFIYNAAPNNSLDSKTELVTAVKKARTKGVGN